MDRAKCVNCPLLGHSTPAQPIGDARATALVVVDTPTAGIAEMGRLLSKPSMEAFVKGMKPAGFSKEDFYFVPQIRCPHDEGVYSTKEKRLIKNTCRAHLLDEIDASEAQVIVPMGAEPVSQVMGRPTKITKVRGVLEESEEFQNRYVFPMLSPKMVAAYPQHEVTFSSDCQTLSRLLDHGFDIDAAAEGTLGDYEIVEDLEFLVKRKPKIVSFDTETTSLRFYQPGQDVRTYNPKVHDAKFRPSAAILTMQFAVEEGSGYMLVWDHPEAPIAKSRKMAVAKQIQALLCNPDTTVIGQNAKYDATYLLWQTGIRYRIGGDTLTLATLLDENAYERNLDILTKRYAPEMSGYADRFNATYAKDRMWEIPLSSLVDYGVGDVDATLRVYNHLLPEVADDEGLWANYQHVQLPGLNTFVTIENVGMHVDNDALNVFEERLDAHVTELNTQLLAQVPRAVKRKHIDKGLKFSRADFTRDVLFSKEGFGLKPIVFTSTTAKLDAARRVPSTSSKDHLPYFFDECPFTMELAELIKYDRLLGTNVRGYKKKYVVNGRVRPIYSMTKTVTGRTSCLRGDVLIDTMRGRVRADSVVVGDMVFTHVGRWKKVTKLYLKPVTQMYEVHTSGGVLAATADHRLLLDDGSWVTLRVLMEAYDAERIKIRHAERYASEVGSRVLPQELGHTVSDGRRVWGEHSDGEGDDYASPYCGRVQDAEGDEVLKLEISREESAVWESLGVGLRGWVWLSYEVGEREKVSGASYSCGGNAGDEALAITGQYRRSSYRRGQDEQQSGQFSHMHESGACSTSSTLSGEYRRLDIEKIICEKSHRVYDFEVEEDHSYLACGVFNHNSQDPNGQNIPNKTELAKAYKETFVAPEPDEFAPEGYFILSADLSQAELRIAADMANERTMIRIYREGGDIHMLTAAISMAVSLDVLEAMDKAEKKKKRQGAKAINFGLNKAPFVSNDKMKTM